MRQKVTFHVVTGVRGMHQHLQRMLRYVRSGRFRQGDILVLNGDYAPVRESGRLEWVRETLPPLCRAVHSRDGQVFYIFGSTEVYAREEITVKYVCEEYHYQYEPNLVQDRRFRRWKREGLFRELGVDLCVDRYAWYELGEEHRVLLISQNLLDEERFEMYLDQGRLRRADAIFATTPPARLLKFGDKVGRYELGGNGRVGDLKNHEHSYEYAAETRPLAMPLKAAPTDEDMFRMENFGTILDNYLVDSFGLAALSAEKSYHMGADVYFGYFVPEGDVREMSDDVVMNCGARSVTEHYNVIQTWNWDLHRERLLSYGPRITHFCHWQRPGVVHRFTPLMEGWG